MENSRGQIKDFLTFMLRKITQLLLGMTDDRCRMTDDRCRMTDEG